jgi:hypothetical protein
MEGKKLKQEKLTVEIMVKMFCHGNHRTKNELCEECAKLLQYSEDRIDRCPFQENKPSCSNCTIHCYKKDERELIRKVMGFAGPRMIFSHPVLAIQHLFSHSKKTPK